jgi:hypothetical protein
MILACLEVAVEQEPLELLALLALLVAQQDRLAFKELLGIQEPLEQQEPAELQELTEQQVLLEPLA